MIVTHPASDVQSRIEHSSAQWVRLRHLLRTEAQYSAARGKTIRRPLSDNCVRSSGSDRCVALGVRSAGAGYGAGISYHSRRSTMMQMLRNDSPVVRVAPSPFVESRLRASTTMQVPGNNSLPPKITPPLIVGPGRSEKFLSGVRRVVDPACQSTEFCSEAIGLAKRAVNV